MIENLFSNPMIILYAILFAITMKLADLMDEHKLKWFKGDAILFGFLWGIFGSLFSLSNNIIANLVLAMSIAFIIRGRLDYMNHQIAASIIIISFLFNSAFVPLLFISFYFVFLILGGLRDYIGDVLKKKKGIFYLYDNFMLYYIIPTLIYCTLYGGWIIFWAFFVFSISYDITKYVYKKKGYF
ncbi:MAG: hypothetical protein KJ566_03705 [Nanoarchaeota archaeon]|nr:hypothetical protein [Nanoarchaeota archaeon]